MNPEESIRHLKAAQLMLLGKDNQPISDLYYAIQSGVDAIEENTRKVCYLCDTNKPDCEKTNCSEEFCHHTTDVNHAINFEKVTDEVTGEIIGYMEKKVWNPIKMRTGTDEEYEEFCKYGDCPKEDFRIFECQMPDDDQEVLITTRWGDVCTDIWHSEIDCSWFEDHEDIDDVIAWMPKPERYQEEYEEAKNDESREVR